MKPFLLIIGFVLAAAPALAQRALVHAGKLIDGQSDTVRQKITIVIEAGKISAIEEGFSAARAGDKVYDLREKFVMPGFIDLHTHLSFQTERAGYLRRFQMYPPEQALIASRYARTTLLSGFTTVRDLGGNEFVDVALRNAINRGDIVGPRMFIATKPLAVLGGHADTTNSYREDILGIPDADQAIVSGVESARRATLLAIKRGADVIKITATAGILSLSGGGQLPQFTEDEIRVVVQTAADFGLKVAAHAHGAEGMKRAVRAGVHTIEHGTLMDAEAMDLMKKKQVYWVPTIIAGKSVAEFAKIEGYYHPLVVPKALAMGPLIQKTFSAGYKAGVPIAFGTDAAVFPHGQNAREFQYMVEGGMPPMEAIKSATYHAAKVLDRLNEIGTLSSGKRADIIAVDTDPLQDVTALQKVTFVMKDGVVYKGTSDSHVP